MPRSINWLSITICSMIMPFVIIVFYCRNKRQKLDYSIYELSEPKWSKLGKISEMYIYPLMSGKRRIAKECEITSRGIIKTEEMSESIIHNGMFLVYHPDKFPQNCKFKNKGKLITSVNFPQVRLIDVVINDEKVLLLAPGTSKFVFDTNYIKTCRTTSITNCEVSCCKNEISPIECIDCGEDAAIWISQALTGHNYHKDNLRLAFCGSASNVLEHFRKCYCINITYYNTPDYIYNFIHMDMLDNVMIGTHSLCDVTKALKSTLNTFIFNPNIVILTQETFSEVDKWEWMKIGDVIIKNKMQNVNKETNLKANLSNIFPRFLQIGINCEVYSPGKIKIDEEVLITYSSQINIKKNK